jgi:hypothetical protein
MGACGSSLPVVSLQLNNPTASSDDEDKLVQSFNAQIVDAVENKGIRESFKNYKDKSALIGQAISNPNDAEKKELAMKECRENVQFCEMLVDLATTNGKYITDVYNFIMEKSGGVRIIQTIEQFPLLAKSLATAIKFAMDFDAIKLTQFKITGDISYYRRCLSNSDIDEFGKVGMIGQFFGSPAPFVQKIYQAFDGIKEKERVINFFGSYCDVFTSLLDKKDLGDDIKLLLVHAIGGLFIIIDSIAPSGAFCSVKFFSNVDAARVIALYTPKQNGVISAVIYNSRNFSKPTTLPKISEYLKI